MTPTTRETADHAELERLSEIWSDTSVTNHKMPGDTALVWSARLKTLLSEIAALRGELHSEERFMRSYPEAVRKGHWESVARLLSGRLREMDKRAKAANIAREQAERQRDELRKALEPSPEMIRVGAWRAMLHREANPGDSWEDTAREVFTIMVAASDADASANQGADQ